VSYYDEPNEPRILSARELLSADARTRGFGNVVPIERGLYLKARRGEAVYA